MNGFNISDIIDAKLGGTSLSAIYLGSNKLWPTAIDYSKEYLTIESLADNNTISFKKSASSALTKTIYWSSDKTTWNSVSTEDADTTLKTLSKNEKIYIKGNNNNYSANTLKLNHFDSDAEFNISGNIMSLIYGDNFIGQTTLPSDNYNFNGIFRGSKVVDASNLILPATTLADNCYRQMFRNCTSLTAAPELPATTLTNYCYYDMFDGCTSLTTAPELPATTLTIYCYAYMFNECTSLSYIKCLATDISASSCLSYWVQNVAATGTFVKEYKLKSIPINSESGIPEGWVIEELNDYSKEYFTIKSLTDNNVIGFSKYGDVDAKTIYWSSDKTTWNSVSSSDSDTGATLKTLSKNEKIYIKGSNNSYASNIYRYNYFIATHEINISGNIMSLIYGDNFIGQTTLPSDSYIFCSIFRNSKVVDASNLILPATTLADNCYQQMFRGCTSLISAPELPATTLTDYCYSYMFRDCTSLTSAPELPATTLADSCYRNMFYGCTNLTAAPEELPATTLNNYCYAGIFYNCTSLTAAPELSATTLANYCYQQMFYGCTSLASAPELPATTLADSCYASMFRGCSSLTSAPELPATTLVTSCYSQMFYRCTSLSYIKCLATDISASQSHSAWLMTVATTGTFVKPSSMTSWGTGSSGIPRGWTVENI